ncbi:MAG: Omp28-related outer membrane protein [Bacteroidota bacterium]
MKKHYLKLTSAMLVLSSFIFLGCSKDDDSSGDNNTPSVTIEQKNRALVIDITGTWCPPCGAYGIPGFNDGIAKGKDKMVPFAIHISDPLTVAGMTPIASMGRFMTTSVPRIAVGNGLAFPAGVYTDIGLTGDKIIESVDTFIANNPVVVGVALNNLKVDGSNISVDVHSKFFNTAATGDYQMAVYFYENGVISSQKMSGQPDNPNQQHDHTIRAIATPSAWGEAISISGDTRTKTYTAPMNAAWKSANMGAIAVIWKKITSSDYLYINGNIK